LKKNYVIIIAALFYASPMISFSIELKGVGRATPAKIFAKWGDSYAERNPGTVIKYKAANTTEGVKQVEYDEADFGETDMPLTKVELNKKGLAQFPYMFSAITPVINVPGVQDGQLQLNGKILGDIFLGKISKWNDPAIVAMNPRLKLPNEKIIVAFLAADAEGTFTLSSYLSKTNPDWKSSVGEGAALKWPVGGVVANQEAMGDYIKKTPYSIGYADIAYTRNIKMTYVRLQNNQGVFVSPHAGSVENAVDNVRWNAANGFCEALTDEAGEGSWPMTSGGYIVIRKTSDNRERRLELLNFLGWGLRVGNLDVASLDFMPIKRTILPLIRDSWNDSPLVLEGATKVSATEVKELLAKGVPIIDARIPAEFDAGHIPQATRVTYMDKSAKSAIFNPLQDTYDLSKLPADKNAPLIIYCNAGACWKSYKLSAVAIKAGYKKIYWFRGGIPEWLEKGYTVTKSGSVAAN
jgi:phosphate transport system substrate-binding protein